VNYKNIFLSLLLLPIPTYSKSNEIRIQELKEAQFKKEIELSEIGKMITEKDELLASYDEKSQCLLSNLVDRKTALLEEKNGNQLSREEKQHLAEALRNEVNEFLNALYKSYEEQKNAAEVITNEIFHKDNVKGFKELESLKFFLIRCAFEQDLVIKLVYKYAACLQELIKINQELTALDK
jgi:hypothetical protein